LSKFFLIYSSWQIDEIVWATGFFALQRSRFGTTGVIYEAFDPVTARFND
jgi:hypothetical protein